MTFLKDIRFFVVLEGMCDLLKVVDAFNKKTQPGNTNLDKVAINVAQCLHLLGERLQIKRALIVDAAYTTSRFFDDCASPPCPFARSSSKRAV